MGCRMPCTCPKEFSKCCPDGYPRGYTICECKNDWKTGPHFCCPTQSRPSQSIPVVKAKSNFKLLGTTVVRQVIPSF